MYVYFIIPLPFLIVRICYIFAHFFVNLLISSNRSALCDLTKMMAHVYQINFIVENIGKRRPNTKKRVTWTFGVNKTQHTVAMTWDKHTGKQSVEMNGKQLWFDQKPGASICCYKWTTEDGIQLHVLSCRSTPKSRKGECYRKYDLMINGQLFALLPNWEGQAPAPGELDTHCKSIVIDLYPKGYKWDKMQQLVCLQ